MKSRINFDSGVVVDGEGLYDKSGAILRRFDCERENFKFDDSVSGRKFLVEIVFRGAVIVYLYPKDLLELGYSAKESVMKVKLKEFDGWVSKRLGVEGVRTTFDPRSYMIYAMLQVA